MAAYVSIPVVLAAVLLLAHSPASGQSVPASPGQMGSRVWPPPVRRPANSKSDPARSSRVRTAQHLDVVPSMSTWGQDGEFTDLPVNALRASSPQHRVIRSPSLQPKPDHLKRHASSHPPHLSHHRPIQPSPAVLPDANQQETWKTPYSYGYFGASSSRHWSRHHGYRDHSTQWRLH